MYVLLWEKCYLTPIKTLHCSKEIYLQSVLKIESFNDGVHPTHNIHVCTFIIFQFYLKILDTKYLLSTLLCFIMLVHVVYLMALSDCTLYFSAALVKCTLYRGILVYNICLISLSNSVSDGATNKSVLNIERA